ncbi:MAG: hypothetical protein F4087_04365 [Gemmatimonadetes bacterium]|nr:hypothetical protein [Gemmatimonadota bacterium]MYA12784.1 hypothetical protein [Gemmatimonadota bacterium]MYD13053.1 hypothetical protein [Gemmatimonadota bacterium]MYE70949.1 hypothetical protein [Gemmatimonadota bacterium]MYJ67735.1 hypothetical protein [Gemmatimonadota bacterium]
MSDTAWLVGGGFASVVLCLIAFWRLIKTEIRQEVGVLRTEFRTMRENDLAHLDEKLGGLRLEVERGYAHLDEKLGELSDHFTRTVDHVDGRITRMGDRIGRLDGRVNRLDGRVTRLDGRVTRLSDRMDTRFVRIDARMDHLGAQMDERIGEVRTELRTVADALKGGLLTSETRIMQAIATLAE